MQYGNPPSRKALLQQDNVTVNSGADYGRFPVGFYTRFSGIAFGTGSITVRFRYYGSTAGPVLVSSSWVVNSGPNILDIPNYASQVGIDVTNCATPGQLVSLFIYGDPVR